MYGWTSLNCDTMLRSSSFDFWSISLSCYRLYSLFSLIQFPLQSRLDPCSSSTQLCIQARMVGEYETRASHRRRLCFMVYTTLLPQWLWKVKDCWKVWLLVCFRWVACKVYPYQWNLRLQFPEWRLYVRPSRSLITRRMWRTRSTWLLMLLWRTQSCSHSQICRCKIFTSLLVLRTAFSSISSTLNSYFKRTIMLETKSCKSLLDYIAQHKKNLKAINVRKYEPAEKRRWWGQSRLRSTLLKFISHAIHFTKIALTELNVLISLCFLEQKSRTEQKYNLQSLQYFPSAIDHALPPATAIRGKIP